jgi:hypothetical protein
MQTEVDNVPLVAINQLIKSIARTEKIIESELKAGEPENGLTIKQYKHLKDKFVNELNELLKQYNLVLQSLT